MQINHCEAGLGDTNQHMPEYWHSTTVWERIFVVVVYIIYEWLTDLSPNCFVVHRKNVVCPTRAVILRGTSKSKYGCSDIFDSLRILLADVRVISEKINIETKNNCEFWINENLLYAFH